MSSSWVHRPGAGPRRLGLSGLSLVSSDHVTLFTPGPGCWTLIFLPSLPARVVIIITTGCCKFSPVSPLYICMLCCYGWTSTTGLTWLGARSRQFIMENSNAGVFTTDCLMVSILNASASCFLRTSESSRYSRPGHKLLIAHHSQWICLPL